MKYLASALPYLRIFLMGIFLLHLAYIYQNYVFALHYGYAFLGLPGMSLIIFIFSLPLGFFRESMKNIFLYLFLTDVASFAWGLTRFVVQRSHALPELKEPWCSWIEYLLVFVAFLLSSCLAVPVMNWILWGLRRLKGALA